MLKLLILERLKWKYIKTNWWFPMGRNVKTVVDNNLQHQINQYIYVLHIPTQEWVIKCWAKQRLNDLLIKRWLRESFNIITDFVDNKNTHPDVESPDNDKAKHLQEQIKLKKCNTECFLTGIVRKCGQMNKTMKEMSDIKCNGFHITGHLILPHLLWVE